MLSTMLVAVLAVATPTSPDTPEAAFDRYRHEINLHDFDRLADDVIARDALFIFAGERHQGIDQARVAFNKTWATLPDEVYSMTEPRWISREASSALVSFRYGYRGTLADGSKLSGGGFGTNLFRRTSAGWRLLYEHLAPDPKLTSKSKP